MTDQVTILDVPGVQMKVCKVPVPAYKQLVRILDPEEYRYSQKILKKCYSFIIGQSIDSNINFYLAHRQIWLFPESGKGFWEDMKIFEKIINLA